MLNRTIYNANTSDADGDVVEVSTKETVVGLCTVEVVGTGANKPTVSIKGKLFNSDDVSVDSGWVDIVTFTDIDDNAVVGRSIGIFTFMKAVVSGNTDSKNIQVSIGYN